jgi:hypothetical protein
MSKRSEHKHRNAHDFTIVAREIAEHETTVVVVFWVCKCGETGESAPADVRAAEAYAYRDFMTHTRQARHAAAS